MTRASFMSVTKAVLMAIFVNSIFLPSCMFDFKIRIGTPDETKVKTDPYTRLGIIEKKVPKLGEVFVYGDTVITGMWLRDLVGEGLLIAEIDKSDDRDHVETLITHLRKMAREGRLPMRTVVVAGGYHVGAAMSIRKDLQIPFAVYTTEKRLRNYNTIGPKLIYVTESMRADTRIMIRSMQGDLVTKFIEETVSEHNIR